MIKNGFNPLRRTWIVLQTTALLFLFTACSPPREQGVQLLLGTEKLQPTTTFELRFDARMVSQSEVGLTATNSPLVFKPTLAGKFVWLSQRSGVFTSAEAFKLGTRYRIRLASGLRQANGEGLRAVLDRSVAAPEFAIASIRSSVPLESTNAPAEPSLKIEFNAEVLASGAQTHFEFRQGARRIPARVSQASEQEYFSCSMGSESATDPWTDAARRLKPSLGANEDTNAPAPKLFSNSLVVRPAKPLIVGGEWKLIVTRDLPSADGNHRLATPAEISIGTVQPFEVASIASENTMRTGKSIRVLFSKPLSPDLTPTNIVDWVKVSPPPAGLSYDVGWNQVWIHGNFFVGSNYQVAVRRGLAAREPFALASAIVTNGLVFEPVPARLYFPSFEADQLGWGNRELPILSVNVPRIQVRAKKLDRNNLIHALRGYRSYYRHYDQDYDYQEPYRQLDYNLIPGRTIHEQSFSISSTLDSTEKTTLNWDDLLGIGKFGAVFLDAQRGGGGEAGAGKALGAQTVVQVTDLGMVWKKAGEKVFVYVFSMHTSAPSPKTAVRLLTDESEILAEGMTDENGCAQMPQPEKSAWLLADSGQDLHAVQLQANDLPLYGFRLPMSWQETDGGKEALLFSDRQVYRPGDTLQLKAICREWSNEHWMIPSPSNVVLRCSDSKGRKFLETNMHLTIYGSLSQAVPLAEGPLGTYQAELLVDGHAQHYSFSVQEYHPNSFEISILGKPVFAAGERPEVPVTAKYYLGKALSKAEVRWLIEAHDAGFAPPGFGEFSFCTDGTLYELGRAPGAISLSGDAASLTNLVLAPEIPFNPQAPQPRSASLEVVITDVNQQTVTKSHEFICHSSDFYFGLKRPKAVVAVGEKTPLNVVAVRTDGSPVQEPIKVRVRVSKVEWRTVRTQGAGRSAVYTSEPVMTNILERELLSTPLTQTGEQWDWRPGAFVELFTFTAPGFYLIEAEGTDSAGRRVLAAFDVNVYGAESLGWNYRNPTQIELVPQEKHYAPGQTATLLVKTPISGRALVTVERERVLRSFVTELEGNAPVVRVQLLDSDAPNVFVSVMLLRGAAQSPKKFKQPEMRLGYCQLSVDQPANKLTVQVRPATNDYLPGEYVQLEARIQDGSGEPVPEAEVTLYAVDEGVLSLTGYPTPDPLTFFYKPRGLAVRTSVSLPNLLPEDPDQLVFANKGYLVGGGGGLNRVRKNFLACAFWDGNLITDKDGIVRASFHAPDGLTRYRVIAVAQTKKHQFGAGESAFQVNKPIMIEPVLPRFANVGDKIFARAVLLSRHPVAGEVEVMLKLDDKAFTTNATIRTIKLPANGSASLDLPVEFIQTGKATWTWSARFTETPDKPLGSPRVFNDSIQTTLAVGFPVAQLREIHLGRTGTDLTNLLAAVNPQLLEGKGTVTVSVSNTRLGEMAEAVSQLLHYPYGCVEQTSSSLLPWIVLEDLQPALPQLNKAPAEIGAAVCSGVNRLLSMQTSGGGLSYWPGGREPLFWGSAYGGMVLALAKRHQQSVPAAAWKQLLNYLSAELRKSGAPNERADLGEACFGLYTLSLGGRAEHALQETMYAKRHLLGAESRALLALAIAESKGPESMIKELLQNAGASAEPMHGWFGCDARDVAIKLLARLAWKPSDPQVDVLITELMRIQTKGHWYTTQGDAWALFAMTDYARRIETGLKDAAGSVRWGTQQVNFAFQKTGATMEFPFPIQSELASTPLRLNSSSTNLLFTQVKAEAWPRIQAMPAQDRGYRIHRAYTRLDDSNKRLNMDGLRVGDRVLVTLEFDVRQPAHYLAIDDPLPANLESVQPEFKTQNTRADDQLERDWVSDFHELRTDRALFFRDHLGPGSYRIQYLARVRSAGNATAPGAKIEEMYHPERFGITETLRLTSLPLE